MLKIHQVFITKFLLLFVGVFLGSVLISYIALKSIVINHNTNHLKSAIELIELELDRVQNLDIFAKKVHEVSNLRLTFIDTKGLVLAESNREKEEMDNHLLREEILNIKDQKYGTSIRYSNSVHEDFLYVVKLSSHKDQKIYLRLAMSLEQVMSDFYSLWSRLIFVFLFIVAIALYFTKAMSNRILYDIKQITSYLDEVSNKNYKAILKTKYFFEFLQISLILKNLVKKLSNRDKKKRKYTAKLRLINKQRNDILSAISHEFKNPIASIMGYAQTLLEDDNIKPEIRQKFLSKINANGEKISQMLDRLALSVKLENNDLDLKFSDFDLYALCNEVITNLKSKYKDREIELIGKKSMIHADKTMIELVLINLIDNALKYSQEDVKVEIQEEKIMVRDKGIGIKTEHLEQVTHKFYRVDKNTWDNSMGIGLAMVSYILKAHHTSLEIDSEFTKGSTFSFSISSMRKK
ncbi:MAG: sensor histidine kinase [Helicobacteraceae bacterium]|nr:sensor histidine kinase [Helicobacteraceae bacterium]